MKLPSGKPNPYTVGVKMPALLTLKVFIRNARLIRYAGQLAAFGHAEAAEEAMSEVRRYRRGMLAAALEEGMLDAENDN